MSDTVPEYVMMSVKPVLVVDEQALMGIEVAILDHCKMIGDSPDANQEHRDELLDSIRIHLDLVATTAFELGIAYSNATRNLA